jgi:hypothetical protein
MAASAASWVIENTCVVYDANAKMGNRMVLLKADRPETAPSQIIPWPARFVPGGRATPYVDRLRKTRLNDLSPESQAAAARCVWRDKPAFAVKLENDNLWHVRLAPPSSCKMYSLLC